MKALFSSLKRALIIVRKELLALLGNKISRMLIIVPPLAQIVIFGWAVAMEARNVALGHVNHDNSLWSGQIINAVKGFPTFHSVIWLDGDKAAEKALNEQKVLAALVFAGDFSAKIGKGQSAPVQILLDGRRSNATQIVSAYIG